jgi:hypothetical protein
VYLFPSHSFLTHSPSLRACAPHSCDVVDSLPGLDVDEAIDLSGNAVQETPDWLKSIPYVQNRSVLPDEIMPSILPFHSLCFCTSSQYYYSLKSRASSPLCHLLSTQPSWPTGSLTVCPQNCIWATGKRRGTVTASSASPSLTSSPSLTVSFPTCHFSFYLSQITIPVLFFFLSVSPHAHSFRLETCVPEGILPLLDVLNHISVPWLILCVYHSFI